MYHPDVGRFLSRDPIEDDLNLYGYVNNDPLNATDPTGLAEWLRGTMTNKVTSDGTSTGLVVLPDKGDSGLPMGKIQALLEKAFKAWVKKPGKMVFSVNRPCPDGTTEGPGKSVTWNKEFTGTLKVFAKLEKSWGTWQVVIVTDPTKEKDQKSLGMISFQCKYRQTFDGKGGPCIEKKKTACDDPAPCLYV